MPPLSRVFLALVLAAGLAAPGAARQASPPPAPAVQGSAPALAEERVGPEDSGAEPNLRLPLARTTEHRIDRGDISLSFNATAGALTLTDADGHPEADIAFVAYTLPDEDPALRPVTFAVNGGPGAASAYLHLGALGPWRVPIDPARPVPSQPVALVANPETWLPFTDLVFLDPVGTGFSRLVEPDDRTRNRYLSIHGDIEALADAILRWLTENGRIASSKYFVGESYGGFRGPLLAERLATDHGLTLAGMILISPVLDFGWWQQPSHSPLPRVSLLPSLAAAAMELEGRYSDAALREVETYASGAFITDLLRGLADSAATERVVQQVTGITGLEPATVERAAGRVDAQLFARELLGDEGQRLSLYDATIASPQPFPEDPMQRGLEPGLDALTAPLTAGMLHLHSTRLGWHPDRRYRLLNDGVNGGWDWGGGRGQPEAVTALRRLLALDPAFRLIVVHGSADLVTPYFASELILRQLAPEASTRAKRETLRGGHMFYFRQDSREALRDSARVLYDDPQG